MRSGVTLPIGQPLVSGNEPLQVSLETHCPTRASARTEAVEPPEPGLRDCLLELYEVDGQLPSHVVREPTSLG